MNKLSELINSKNKIDVSNWKEFRVGDLFEFPKVKKIQKIPKEVGDVPFISSKSENNGIATMCNLEPQINKAITISTNGNNFDCYWHEYYFIPGSDVEVIKNKNLNKYNALFICSILHKESEKYSYGKKAKNKAVENTIIKLPVDEKGKPNWRYMEEWERERAIRTSLEKLDKKIENKKVFVFRKQKKFLINELFDVFRGSRIVKNRDYKEFKNHNFKYPVITSKTDNNAIDGYYHSFNSEGNVITSGGEATGMISFYQKEKCWVMDRSRILKPKFNLNEKNALFIIPQLNKYSQYFGYSKSANPEDIKKLTLTLPINNKNNPDWEFMEQYIRERERERADRKTWFFEIKFQLILFIYILQKTRSIKTKSLMGMINVSTI